MFLSRGLMKQHREGCFSHQFCPKHTHFLGENAVFHWSFSAIFWSGRKKPNTNGMIFPLSILTHSLTKKGQCWKWEARVCLLGLVQRGGSFLGDAAGCLAGRPAWAGAGGSQSRCWCGPDTLWVFGAVEPESQLTTSLRDFSAWPCTWFVAVVAVF